MISARPSLSSVTSAKKRMRSSTRPNTATKPCWLPPEAAFRGAEKMAPTTRMTSLIRSPPYEVVVRFEFAPDVLGGDKWKGREQDAFTWVTVLARKPDGSLETLIDWECG